MPLVINDAKHWRHRAEEARALAREITNAKVKAAMLQAADGYDHLAKLAEERAAAREHQLS